MPHSINHSSYNKASKSPTLLVAPLLETQHFINVLLLFLEYSIVRTSGDDTFVNAT